jgi:predicted dehydrogenase
MSQTVVAVVGAGFIGPVHVEGLRRAGVAVKGILDITPDKSRQAAQRLGLPHSYSDFAQVLSDREVQAVHITTPNRTHFEMASAALRAGKHVMCEKPLAMNSQESAELVRIARASGRAAGVNYNIRFYPLCREAAQRVQDGSLGDVFHVTGSYVQDWLFYPTDFNWRVLAEEGGSLRAVADIGTHWLDLVHSIVGLEVESVCADLKTVFPQRLRPRGEVDTFSGKETRVESTEPIDVSTEDYGCVLLRFRGGARGSLHVSQVTAGRKNCLRYEIAGSKLALAWNSERPNELWIGRRERPNEVLLRDPALMSAAARQCADYPGGHNEGFPDTFKQCFRAFYQSIAAGDFADRPSFPTFTDGHREILLCEAILASHQQQRWVDVPSPAG